MLYAFDRLFDLPMYWSYEYTRGNFLKETDFLIEADNGERAAAELANCFKRDEAHVPKVYREHTTKRILTCEWIDGVKLTDREGLARVGATPAQVMDTLVNLSGYQIFNTGFLHCDPHPGTESESDTAIVILRAC